MPVGPRDTADRSNDLIFGPNRQPSGSLGPLLLVASCFVLGYFLSSRPRLHFMFKQWAPCCAVCVFARRISTYTRGSLIQGHLPVHTTDTYIIWVLQTDDLFTFCLTHMRLLGWMAPQPPLIVMFMYTFFDWMPTFLYRRSTRCHGPPPPLLATGFSR